MRYFNLQILLVVLIILGSFPGIYANIVQDNNSMNISKINDVSTNGTQTIYVAKNGTDRNDGLTPGTPKRNIEIAINAADPGDTIKVGPGTYQVNLIINKNLTLIGDTQNNTIINGPEINKCIVIPGGLTVTIANFTIEGVSDRELSRNGGGIDNYGTLTLENSTITNNTSGNTGGICNDGTMTIKNVTIKNNRVTSWGGGINNEGTLTLENSTITNNTSIWGGGIYNRCTMTIKSVTVKNNNATDEGGGIDNKRTVVIENSTITNNTSQEGGGGICNHGVLTMYGSTITNNRAKNGGGIDTSCTLTMEDSTIMNNTSKEKGGGIYNSNLLTMYGSTITNNRAKNGGGIYNGEDDRARAYIDDISVLTGNLPNNFEGIPFIPA